MDLADLPRGRHLKRGDPELVRDAVVVAVFSAAERVGHPVAVRNPEHGHGLPA